MKNNANIQEKKESRFNSIEDYINRLEILADIYNDFLNKDYTKKTDLEIAKLKMQLTKKELLLINYILSKEIENINI
ncbi:MAG: hypothetical protein QXM96_03775 [Candidatus Woesearchaeota archaeon]